MLEAILDTAALVLAYVAFAALFALILNMFGEEEP